MAYVSKEQQRDWHTKNRGGYTGPWEDSTLAYCKPRITQRLWYLVILGFWLVRKHVSTILTAFGVTALCLTAWLEISGTGGESQGPTLYATGFFLLAMAFVLRGLPEPARPSKPKPQQPEALTSPAYNSCPIGNPSLYTIGEIEWFVRAGLPWAEMEMKSRLGDAYELLDPVGPFTP